MTEEQIKIVLDAVRKGLEQAGAAAPSKDESGGDGCCCCPTGPVVVVCNCTCEPKA